MPKLLFSTFVIVLLFGFFIFPLDSYFVNFPERYQYELVPNDDDNIQMYSLVDNAKKAVYMNTSEGGQNTMEYLFILSDKYDLYGTYYQYYTIFNGTYCSKKTCYYNSSNGCPLDFYTFFNFNVWLPFSFIEKMDGNNLMMKSMNFSNNMTLPFSYGGVFKTNGYPLSMNFDSTGYKVFDYIPTVLDPNKLVPPRQCGNFDETNYEDEKLMIYLNKLIPRPVKKETEIDDEEESLIVKFIKKIFK